MIPAFAYYEPDTLRRELDNVFRSGWIFACMASEVASNRDFVCVDFAGESIVVQNFQGELRAFRNVCTHRFNRLQTTSRGSRHLVCSYHGWSFDAEGTPRFPAHQQFCGAGERDKLRLKRFRVEALGKFIFVSLAREPSDLSKFLGSFVNRLLELSDYIGDEVHYAEIDHRANWKLLVENVLECYHCQTVHPETFGAGLGVGKEPIADVEEDCGHSSSHFPRSPIRRENLRRRLMSHLDGRPFSHNSFFHVYIFPNLFISSTEGAAFYVGQALPRGVRETCLRVRLFEPSFAIDPAHRVRQGVINNQSATLSRAVIEEDRAILENVQRGLEITDREGVLGADEVRIAHFMHWYSAIMNDRAA